jgi:hypothetical protein
LIHPLQKRMIRRMRKLIIAAACAFALAGAAATYAGPPPAPAKPVSLTIKKSGKNLVVVVKLKGLTKQNLSDRPNLDVRTTSPKGEYGVQSNGPGMPVGVHPYGGNGSTSGPAKEVLSIPKQTATFTFGLKAIKNPKKVKIAAQAFGSEDSPGVKTKFVTFKP